MPPSQEMDRANPTAPGAWRGFRYKEKQKIK